MPNYQLEVRQHESYPRCRLDRDFFLDLLNNRGIRTNGCPGLFAFTALCSLTSFEKTRLNLEGITYDVLPGECVCPVRELTSIWRLHTRRQTLNLLDKLAEKGLAKHTLLNQGRVVKIVLPDWPRANFILREDCPNQRPNGHFSLPAAIASDLITTAKCSEMDILLDLLLSGVYRDSRVKSSFINPVVYFRNDTCRTTVTEYDLAERWGRPRAVVRYTLRKFENAGYITQKTFPGCAEMLIHLEGSLSNAFQLSDALVDKDELPLVMCVPFSLRENELPSMGDIITNKTLHLLSLHGVGCAECPKCTYKLYPLPINRNRAECAHFNLAISCGQNIPIFCFELTMLPDNT